MVGEFRGRVAFEGSFFGSIWCCGGGLWPLSFFGDAISAVIDRRYRVFANVAALRAGWLTACCSEMPAIFPGSLSPPGNRCGSVAKERSFALIRRFRGGIAGNLWEIAVSGGESAASLRRIAILRARKRGGRDRIAAFPAREGAIPGGRRRLRPGEEHFARNCRRFRAGGSEFRRESGARRRISATRFRRQLCPRLRSMGAANWPEMETRRNRPAGSGSLPCFSIILTRLAVGYSH